jgi:hypothetical protein
MLYVALRGILKSADDKYNKLNEEALAEKMTKHALRGQEEEFLCGQLFQTSGQVPAGKQNR